MSPHYEDFELEDDGDSDYQPEVEVDEDVMDEDAFTNEESEVEDDDGTVEQFVRGVSLNSAQRVSIFLVLTACVSHDRAG